ncbi:MAG TPA: cyclopropane fatty acyl phospholipid synthase [Candidatus Saccharimonadales bacterium]|jgi:cyclopropane-fatty-acyl-phospholipid synthase|nr:cyclopropane fatty acyl phospholipid synthase [Candidatus Saccharimonadales bacterium]
MSDSKSTVEQLLKLGDVKINGQRAWDIQVRDERFYKRVLSQGDLGVGESYTDGWWSSNQLDETIARLMATDIRANLHISPALIKTIAVGYIFNRQRLKRAYKNASTHYSVGNDLYSLMLDKRMIYSCGFWQNVKNLDEAQEAKLERICQKLQLKKGMTLLDIGCGWGGFAEYAARNYGVKVSGVSPVKEQVEVARERAKGLDIEILQQDYREITGKYDRVVSVGMMEHVGPKNYRTFFQKCHDLLNDNGITLHHTIGNNRSVQAVSPWIDRYIFPGGVIPSLSQIAKATEKLLVIEDLENFGPDYDKTLMVWHSNFVRNYPKLDHEKYDEHFYRMWEFYLLSCAGAFRARHMQLYQIIMRKIERSESYRGYRG